MTEPVISGAVEDFLASVSAGTLEDKLPVAESLRKKAAAAQKAREDAIRGHVPGRSYREQGGVFTGTYTPRDRKTGEPLGPVFNVYAAPRDYTHRDSFLFTYNEAAARVSRVRNWRGFDGEENCANDTEINAALISGAYGGGWIIPTEEMLCGGFRGNHEHNVRVHKNDGPLKGSFTTEKPRFASIGDYSTCYWSSSENGSHRDLFLGACFDNDTSTVTSHKDDLKFRCRPVRLVRVPD